MFSQYKLGFVELAIQEMQTQSTVSIYLFYFIAFSMQVRKFVEKFN